MPSTNTAPATIQSLDRGLILLEVIATADHPVSLAELTQKLAVDRSTAFRLAATLKRRGFIAQASGKRGYVPGSAFWRLSDKSAWLESLRQMSRDLLVELANTIGETVHLAVRRDTQVYFVDHVLSPQRIGVTYCTVQSDMLHTTSVGKALIIDYDRLALDELYGNEKLIKPTPRAAGTLDELADECSRTRQRGFAIDDEEGHAGVRCFAAPVRDGSGHVIAAVGISGPSERLPSGRWQEVGETVIATASRIADMYGCDSTSVKQT